MGKNLIVSEETIRDLLEAHASLSAWYYELSAALRSVNGAARTPDDAARAAFVERLASDFPEIAAVARSIRVPRMFVPPPPAMTSRPLDPGDEDAPTAVEPAPSRAREASSAPPPQPGVAPPAIVVPGAVKYEGS
jgi:hypothetical protein